MIQAVFLCGGSGTRLWPMSRKVFPKQFAPLLDNKSLLQLTLAHVVQLGGQGAGKVSGTVVLELAPRNTEAAVAPAALSVPPEQLMLFCPANHHIPNAQAFVVMVEQGLAVTGQCAIITFVVVVQLSQHHVQLYPERPDSARRQPKRCPLHRKLHCRKDPGSDSSRRRAAERQYFSVPGRCVAQRPAPARARHSGPLAASHGRCGNPTKLQELLEKHDCMLNHLPLMDILQRILNSRLD